MRLLLCVAAYITVSALCYAYYYRYQRHTTALQWILFLAGFVFAIAVRETLRH